ncbi:HTH CENPB-type domain-containing protein [Trichonephila clavipes]|nr:HTH CENPB-type domain-containing protein [Trichonephila clavipes]
MGPGKRNKRSEGFKIKAIQFVKEDGNRGWQQGYLILVEAPYVINIPKKKCALRKGVTKWPILEESIAYWVLENRQNGLIVTINSVRLFALKWSKKNANDRNFFKATCNRFMARNNLVLREKTKLSQMLPKDVDN